MTIFRLVTQNTRVIKGEKSFDKGLFANKYWEGILHQTY
jgi:hypothetical protein